MKKNRLYLYVNPETENQFERLRKALELNKTDFGNLCILIAVSSLRRLLEPEKTLTVDDWTKLIKAGKSLGVEVGELVKDAQGINKT